MPLCRALSAAHAPSWDPDIRSSTFKGYAVFFRYWNELLEIVSILEGRREIDGHFEPTRQE